MTIDETISELRSTELHEQSRDKIESLIHGIGKIAHSLVTITDGLSITRARPHLDLDETFQLVSDYSYKPQSYNKTYQRASTPLKTMFYGSIIPEYKISSTEDVIPPRIVTAMEASPWLRDPKNSGYRKISFGKWVSTEKLNFLVIIHENQFEYKTEFAKNIIMQYNDGLKHSDDEIRDKSQKFYNFLAQEFSKDVITNHSEYMISALFTETLTNNYPQVDGILYPSVRALGRGFNVALTPEACKKLKLVAALECSVYKKGEEIRIGNDKSAQLNGDEEEFQFALRDNNQNLLLQDLGISSLEELKLLG